MTSHYACMAERFVKMMVPGPDGTAGVLHTSIEQVRFLRGLPSHSCISMAERTADYRGTEVRFLPGVPISGRQTRIKAKVVNPKPPRVEETAMTDADKRRSGHVTGAAIGPGF